MRKRIKSGMLWMVLLILLLSQASCETSPKAVRQEPTGELVLYANPDYAVAMNRAVTIFKEKYPDVQVEVQSFGSLYDQDSVADYQEKLRNDLIAGKGPDCVVWSNDFYSSFSPLFPDMYKTMDSGVFVDLNTYVNDDADFDMAAYVEPVMDGGVYKGKRHFVPLEYVVVPLVTTKENMDKAGVAISDNKDITWFTGAVEQLSVKYSGDFTKDLWEYPPDKAVYHVFPWAGAAAVDYEKRTVQIESNDFKAAMDMCKALYPFINNRERMATLGDHAAVSLQKGNLIFRMAYFEGDLFFFQDYASASGGFTPVSFAFPSVSGKAVAEATLMAAIPRNSPNQVNAYNYIKILLSDEIQALAGYDALLLGMPVLKDGVKKRIEARHLEFREGGYVKELDLQFGAVPQEVADDFLKMVTDVVYAKNQSNTIKEFIQEAMTPYFEGTKSYEDCIKKLKNELELYIHE